MSNKGPVLFLQEAIRLFEKRNAVYAGKDSLEAFTSSSPVNHGWLTPLEYCMTLCAKQDDAVWRYMQEPTPERLAELRERLLDGIVYRAIALALLARSGAA